MKILVIDVGGTHLKVLATGHKQGPPSIWSRRPPPRPRNDQRSAWRFLEGRLAVAQLSAN